jgi:hypothetical protein
MRTRTPYLVAGVAVVLLCPSLQASAESPYGTRHRPLEGKSYETLRALAQHLDETARGALEGATDDVQQAESSAEARFLSSIRSFARRADDFQRMVGSYPTSPFEVPAHVEDLATRAHQVNDSIHSAHALKNTYDDWEAVLDVLERIRLLLVGGDVEVPAAHVVAALSGSRLHEFRQLALEVANGATQAHEKAKQDVGDYPARGQQFVGELHYFAVQSRELHDQADAGPVDPQQIGPIVDHLLAQAREADRRMRDARVFASVWDDSGRTITILLQMTRLVRSRPPVPTPLLVLKTR